MTTLLIDRLGAQGDGVADTLDGPVYVPFALPGERVNAAVEGSRGTLMAVLEASPMRVEPVCRHFADCGGCALQHLDPVQYRAWKRDRVVQALAARGIDAEVSEIVAGTARSRRRAVFSARKTEAGIVLGYNRAASHAIVDIEECFAVLPEIEASLPMLRSLATLIAVTRDSFHLTVTSTASGLDVAATGSGKLTEKSRREVSDFALRNGLARLSVDGEIIIEPRKPMVQFGSAAAVLPPGGFLQAVAAAEEAMDGIVAGHLKRAKKVADLFAGAGAFALRLASRSEVHAVEADAAALAALDRAFRGTPGLRRITVEKRDLFRRPLTFKELNAFEGVVFDPPRAGAEDQSKQIARSDVPYVAAISCNPATLARDLRILIDGGYAVKQVTPVDQFLWSPHVEVAALLEKPRKRR
ncbi:class I SAM-dependent RNA methyltransferase [Pseudaminobacter sp. 19-2017]|uniref:Class I SAM-dependent RNA methyltransferase n=1 Tax=Pseudaminobacter soli (ex Zhang et al. 2022) TaxID=2831468 RepID=A0A942I7C8_9HYPH|nr:class I SAM-dependent RNA methyltransferase [Pseudaminobacter soli]MBS3648260.1 class I SAM-dependent RNA methyltransferase [Pseudaminobacter soli]